MQEHFEEHVKVQQIISTKEDRHKVMKCSEKDFEMLVN